MPGTPGPSSGSPRLNNEPTKFPGRRRQRMSSGCSSSSATGAAPSKLMGGRRQYRK